MSSLDHQPARAISPARRDVHRVTWASSGNADFYPKSARSRPRGASLAYPSAGPASRRNRRAVHGFSEIPPSITTPTSPRCSVRIAPGSRAFGSSATVFLMRKSPMLIDAWLISSLHGRASRYPAVRYSSPRARHRRHSSGAIPKAQPAALGDYPRRHNSRTRWSKIARGSELSTLWG